MELVVSGLATNDAVLYLQQIFASKLKHTSEELAQNDKLVGNLQGTVTQLKVGLADKVLDGYYRPSLLPLRFLRLRLTSLPAAVFPVLLQPSL